MPKKGKGRKGKNKAADIWGPRDLSNLATLLEEAVVEAEVYESQLAGLESDRLRREEIMAIIQQSGNAARRVLEERWHRLLRLVMAQAKRLVMARAVVNYRLAAAVVDSGGDGECDTVDDHVKRIISSTPNQPQSERWSRRVQKEAMENQHDLELYREKSRRQRVVKTNQLLQHPTNTDAQTKELKEKVGHLLYPMICTTLTEWKNMGVDHACPKQTIRLHQPHGRLHQPHGKELNCNNATFLVNFVLDDQPLRQIIALIDSESDRAVLGQDAMDYSGPLALIVRRHLKILISASPPITTQPLPSQTPHGAIEIREAIAASLQYEFPPAVHPQEARDLARVLEQSTYGMEDKADQVLDRHDAQVASQAKLREIRALKKQSQESSNDIRKRMNSDPWIPSDIMETWDTAQQGQEDTPSSSSVVGGCISPGRGK